MPIELTITLISIAAAAIGTNYRLLFKLSKDHAEACAELSKEHAETYASLSKDHAKLTASIDGVKESINRIDATLNTMQQHLYGTAIISSGGDSGEAAE